MISILCLFFISASPSGSTILQEKIEVRVGKDKIITTSDIDQLTERLVIENPTADRKQIRVKARDELIDQALRADYLKQYGMEIGDRDVKNAMLASFGLKSDSDLRDFIQSHFGDFEAFQNQFRSQMERSRFFSVIQRQSSRTKDEAAMMNYFNRNRSELEKNRVVELEECTIPNSADKSAADQALAFVKNPKDFHVCIKKFGHGAGKAAPTGALKFESGSLPEFVEKKVFELKPGEVAQIQLPGRIQLLKLVSIKNLKPFTFEQLKSKIEARLEEQSIASEVDRIMSDLRSNSFVKILS